MIDLHWRFAARFLGGGTDAERALARRVPVSLEGKTAYSLAPEDLLLALCLHGSYNLWPSLGAVSDVARLVQTQGPWDWPGLVKRAEGVGLRRILLLGLSLATELLAAPVPPEVVAQAEGDPVLPALRQQVLSHLCVRKGEEPGFLETSWFQARTLDCLKDRLTYAWVRAAFPTMEDWRWVPLPDYLYWLYFLIRPLRLATQGLILPLLRRLSVLVLIRIVGNCFSVRGMVP